jgi:AcrR family transcriptional regulator
MAELDLARIAAAALAVVDEHGPGGLTMRAVADALGVTPMALYHHVENKAALVGLMVDAAIAEHPLPAPTGDGWDEDVYRLALFMRDGAQRHPAVARLRVDHQTWGPAVLGLGERWLDVWQQSGLEPDDAATAAMTTLLAINGIVQQEATLPRFQPPDGADLGLRPDLRLALHTRIDRDAAFELLVRSIVEGVHERLARPRR